MAFTIGIDFDNTIALYDQLIHQLALSKGWITRETACSKTVVRDLIRKLPNGEAEWQKIQAQIYGPQMSQALLAPGFTECVQLLRQKGVLLHIISHKTGYSQFDPDKTNLRDSALDWMKAHNFFAKDGLGFQLTDIHFESTRQEKIMTIERLNCQCFIDDLIEVFEEPSFPASVQKILFSSEAPKSKFWHVVRSWQEIKDFINFRYLL